MQNFFLQTKRYWDNRIDSLGFFVEVSDDYVSDYESDATFDPTLLSEE